MNETILLTILNIANMTPGAIYTVTPTPVAEDTETAGQNTNVVQTTKPAVIRNLTVSDITTSSVYLSWTQPEGTSSFYRVEWTDGSTTMKNTTQLKGFNVINLTSGINHTFGVSAVAGDNITTGLDSSVSQYTRPQQPSNITVWDRSNSNLIVKWTLPAGVVDFYNTSLSNDALNVTYSNTVKTETANFSQLQPGRLYMFTATAVAGAFSNQSDGTQIATLPNPPGAVFIPSKDNASLTVQWALPALMEKAPNVSYNIIYQCPGCTAQNKTSLSNGTTLPGLASGTFYNITVITVGPQGYLSTGVHNSSYTLPNPVLSLRAQPASTNSVHLTWAPPLNVQTNYNYTVQASNNQSIKPAPPNNTEATVFNLEPGTLYNFTVTTVAGPGSETTSEYVASYTHPKAVTNLTVQDPKTNPVRLTWSRQEDFKATYSYLVIVTGKSGSLNFSVDTESCDVSNLIPGGLYTFVVFTVVGGVRSNQVNTSSYIVPGIPSGIVVIGTTTSLTVTWSAPNGTVEFYTVQLLNATGLISNATINASQSLSVPFQNLSPGQLYNVKVIARSGPLTQESLQVQNATFPNPPGSIIIGERNTSSINFSWAQPVNMLAGNYSFFAQLSPGQNKNSTDNWIVWGNLQSGTLYSINVTTVGALGYQSTAVTAASYTRPNSVSMLTVIGITPTSVDLTWVQTDQQAYSYQVNVTDGRAPSVINTTTTTIPGLQSGSNYTFTVTTMTQDGTTATPVTVFYFTRPYPISGLTATTLNTTAVKLTWTQPLQNQSSYTYRVMTTVCVSAPRNDTALYETDVVSNLTAGTNCTFSVSVVAANGIEGDAILTYQYTKPEVAQLNCSNSMSNNSVLVRWAVPSGNVDQYLVVLVGSLGPLNDTLNSSQTSKNFDNLSAATIYNAMVTTASGPFNATSLSCATATSPNPPGPIKIMNKTTSSLSLQWDEAPLMSKSSFTYLVTYTSSINGDKTNMTPDDVTTLSNLSSGTPYNISLVTVGPLNLTSAEVRLNSVTTRPEIIRNLFAEDAAEGSVTLTWSQPIDVKPGYQYQVNGTNSSNVTTDNTTVIPGLDPGSRYNFTVTSLTADGTTGAPAFVSFCTRASPVSSPLCAGPNDPDAKLVLYWTFPKGGTTGFNVTTFQGNNLVANSVTSNGQCNSTCMVNVTGLRHHTTYSVKVQTLGCGLPSAVVDCSNITGITNPAIPSNSLSLAAVSVIEHNTFTVQLDPNLLNNSQGPVQQIGVLVTSDPSKTDNSDLKQYLDKTYDNWSNGDPAYLATVKSITTTTKSGDNSDLRIIIGNRDYFNNYVNNALKPLGKYSYAIVIFTKMTLTDGLVNVPLSFVSVTQWYGPITMPQDPAVIGAAVGASMGCFLVLLVILISGVVYLKRRQAKKTTDIPIHSIRSKVSVPVRVEEYEAYYKKQKADSNCGFAEEFEELKTVGTSQVKNSALAMENKSKNRYNNVLPYDSSRVKLSTHGSPFDDYINANYIPGHNSRKEFIAAQGPLPVTVNEFWRMIWEKNVQTLVMLTRCNEQGRVKCEEYWPSDIRSFGNITVTTTSEIPLEDWTIRDFNVKNVKTAETRSVRHFHFTAWPDHGVPETTELLINFRHLVREHMEQYSRHSPTIVHCSAGVGRTGTFIAIDRLIFQIERESTVDVFGTIHDLRMHRPLMVQTEDQYVFLNQCAIDIIRSRTGTNVDLIYQNTAALSIYENVEPKKCMPKNGYHNA